MPGDRILICTGEILPKRLASLLNADSSRMDTLTMLDACPDNPYAALLLRPEDPDSHRPNGDSAKHHSVEF